MDYSISLNPFNQMKSNEISVEIRLRRVNSIQCRRLFPVDSSPERNVSGNCFFSLKVYFRHTAEGNRKATWREPERRIRRLEFSFANVSNNRKGGRLWGGAEVNRSNRIKSNPILWLSIDLWRSLLSENNWIQTVKFRREKNNNLIWSALQPVLVLRKWSY